MCDEMSKKNDDLINLSGAHEETRGGLGKMSILARHGIKMDQINLTATEEFTKKVTKLEGK